MTIYDGLNIVPIDEKSTKKTPTIYVNSMYEHYKEYNNLEEVLREVAGSIKKAFHQAPDRSNIK
ncbi:hypothetical protein [[Clostridium] fimetarium]|uniref:hypothetical protein n=1 Tax=[Clostridium] fimetarium TaxID=99656 RepID=UPI000B8839A9|nr:hypothetical protein [[Clostridium] fimetarium]